MTIALPVAPPAATAAAVPQQQQATTGNQGGVNALSATKFPGIGQALHRLGYTMFDPAMLEAKLKLQNDIQGNVMKQTVFNEFAITAHNSGCTLQWLGTKKQLPWFTHWELSTPSRRQ
jgi:hypothetical protein